MSKDRSYEATVSNGEAEYFINVAQSYLEQQGFEVNVHLHEPPNQMEIFEFSRGEETLSLEINRHEMDACIIKMTSPEIAPGPLVLDIISELCAGLVSTFVKPMLGTREGDNLQARIRAGLKEILERAGGE